MESNSDKVMRDKMQELEFPFDPQAWENMEAMLDKKKKRRGIIWWWFGGVAAGVLLSFGTYQLLNHYGTKQNVIMAANGNNNNTEAALSNSNSAISNSQQSNTNTTNATNNQIANNNNYTNHAVNNTAGTGNESMPGNTTSGKQALANNTKSNAKTFGGNNNSAKTQQLVKANRKQKIHPSSVNNKAFSKQSNSNTTQAAGLLTTFNGIKVKPSTNTEITSDTSEAKNSEVTADKYWLTHLNANLTDDELQKHEADDALPKHKVRLFTYSLGALGNVSGSTLGKQQYADNDTYAGTPFLFSSKPSYMAGLTHDFLFLNRIAISNSILYSKTSFTVYAPKSAMYNPAPLSYTSNITEIAIPIGIKVYPVAKPNFRFYISAGVVNHIKLNETFSYNAAPDTPLSIANNPNNLYDNTNVYPVKTDFNGGGYTYDVSNSNAGVTTVQLNTNEFSVNNAKRYYASFYAGMGVEGIIKRHLIVFAEPSFFMALQKAGIQDKRKYNVGCNVGLRYAFGR
jgi:hypothetical protein